MGFRKGQFRAIRKKQRWPQDVLAKRIGVSQTKISQWERGMAIPTSQELERVARFLGVSVETLASEAAS